VFVDAVDMPGAVRKLCAAASAQQGGYVCVTGVHGVMESQRDEALREIHNQSLLTTPDGMPMVWMGQLQGFREMRRVYGPTLMLEVCRESVQHSFTHFLLGGIPGRVEELEQELERRFPGIAIVGVETPPFRTYTSDEELALVARVQALRPSFVWIGLSTPKQERLAARLSSFLPDVILLGVGAAFDMHAGRLRQAPAWMQALGLEWLFRLAIEPRRLWRRYLRNNPEFAFRAAAQIILHRTPRNPPTGSARD